MNAPNIAADPITTGRATRGAENAAAKEAAVNRGRDDGDDGSRGVQGSAVPPAPCFSQVAGTVMLAHVTGFNGLLERLKASLGDIINLFAIDIAVAVADKHHPHHAHILLHSAPCRRTPPCGRVGRRTGVSVEYH